MCDGDDRTIASDRLAKLTPDLVRQVEAVRDGAIRDPDQVRAILDQFRPIEGALFDLIEAAEEAFVRGWPT